MNAMNSNTKRPLLGGAMVLIYVIFTAAFAPFVQSKLNSSWNTFALVFFCFLLPACLFYAVSSMRNPAFIQRLVRNPSPVIAINIASIVMWLSYFIGVPSISPAMFIGIALGGGPTYLIVWKMLTESNRPSGTEIGKALLFLVGVLVLCLSEVSKAKDLLHGSLLAVVCGVAIVWFAKLGTTFSSLGWHPREVVAIRFWALLTLAGCVWLVGGKPATAGTFSEGFADVLLASTFGQVIPLYCLQKGIAMLADRAKVARLMALTPVVVFLLEPAFRIAISTSSAIGVSLVVASQFFTIRTR